VDRRLIDVYQSKYNSNEKPFAVSFLTSIDYTIDKMGAPVFNAEGELIGLLSDGNNETISNLYQYNERFQRTIALDIRYVLFILEQYADANRIVEKLSIVDE
ncbi:MAG: S46 family peptidase, partial [Paludibacteraceae bacterium]|nr:S46 family peptidase [Paludibacteraceae bacterium]